MYNSLKIKKMNKVWEPCLNYLDPSVSAIMLEDFLKGHQESKLFIYILLLFLLPCVEQCVCN